MSKIALSGPAAGTATYTLTAPTGVTDRTIVLPDSNGTILTTATAGVPVNGPAFSAYPSASQSLSSGTTTKIQFNVEDFDTNSCYDKDTNYRFQPTVAGYYQISLACAVSTLVGVQAVIFKNGSAYVYGQYAASGNWSNTSALVYLNGSTDYVEGYLYVFANAASLVSTTSKFQGALIRSAT